MSSEKEDRRWTWHGRYGDDSGDWLYLEKLPHELSDNLQKALRELHEKNKGARFERNVGYDSHKNGRRLQELDLIREVGNAWNTSIQFAPQVHQWLKENR